MISPARLRRGIGLGLIILVAVMPFHAFLSVWLGHLFGHQAIFQAWKEVLLAILTVLGAALVARDPTARDRLRTWPAITTAAFALIALVVTVFTRPPFAAIAFGAKTDFEFLVAFLLAILVATPQLIRNLTWTILLTSSVVIGFGLIQSSVLPLDFLTRFGYGDSTIAPYLVLDPAVGNLRFPSTLGGPNQLGTFLILPMALAAFLIIRRRQWWWLPVLVGGVPVLINTFSRAAWLGALAGAVVGLIVLAPPRLRALITAFIAAAGVATALAINYFLKFGGNLQYFIFHTNTQWRAERGSDFQHLESLRQGINSTLSQPLGHGLGTAGPAVIHAGTNGVVIENYFLQLSYETGVIGALAFVAILVTTGWQLARRSTHNDLAAATLVALVGVSVTAIFLPAWTDSSTALIAWIAAGSVIGLTPGTRHV